MEMDFETDANIGRSIEFLRDRHRFGLCQPARAA